MSKCRVSHDSAAPDDDVVAPELVRAPAVPPFRPLKRRVSPIVHRQGAFDYRNSPSLMGGQHVPYRTQT